jgi:hypothetical protein
MVTEMSRPTDPKVSVMVTDTSVVNRDKSFRGR